MHGTFCRTGSYNEIFKNHHIAHGTITVAEFHVVGFVFFYNFGENFN
jgi:hypothetical protein